MRSLKTEAVEITIIQRSFSSDESLPHFQGQEYLLSVCRLICQHDCLKFNKLPHASQLVWAILANQATVL